MEIPENNYKINEQEVERVVEIVLSKLNKSNTIDLDVSGYPHAHCSLEIGKEVARLFKEKGYHAGLVLNMKSRPIYVRIGRSPETPVDIKL